MTENFVILWYKIDVYSTKFDILWYKSFTTYVTKPFSREKGKNLTFMPENCDFLWHKSSTFNDTKLT